MSNRFKQVNAFLQGISADIEDDKLGVNSYKGAINMSLTEEDGMYALKNLKGDVDISLTLPTSHLWIAAFSVTATFGSSKEPRDAVVAFSKVNAGTASAIYIVDATSDAVYMIYDDTTSPSNDREVDLNISPEVDAFYLGDGEDFYLYWVDGSSIRHIKLHVEDVASFDNSVSGKTPLYIANEADLLYVRRLYPVDLPTISDIIEDGGGLTSGSYQIGYRYYNTETFKYSGWSLLTNPVHIIQNDVSVDGTNEIQGYGLNSTTSKSIEIEINKSHRHNEYYNSIQLVSVFKNTDGGSPAVTILRPSEDMYGVASTLSTIVYTGLEKSAVSVITEVVVDESSIEYARTIEYAEGRVFLGNIKYFDLEVQDSTSYTTETLTRSLPVSVDPMVEVSPAAGQGYYDPLNCHLYKGYFRGEVYRFGRTYCNKFGDWSRVSVFDFSDTSFDYDSGDHANTWQKNWRTKGIDWKFADRESQEGAIFEQSGDNLRAFGLDLDGVNNHPSWAYAMAIVRTERKKDILGQTPVINGIAVRGNAHTLNYEPLDGVSFTSHFWLGSEAWDYDGSEDCYEPKIMAMGHAKHIIPYEVKQAVNPNRVWYYMIWERMQTTYADGTRPTDDDDRAASNLIYLYPMEYMANQGGEENSGIQLDGSEFLKIIDCVALDAFNAFRDDQFHDGVDANDFINGFQSKYIWTYSPNGKGSYYYYNGHNVGQMLDPALAPGTGVYVANFAPEGLIRLNGGWKIGTAHPPQPTSQSHSSDDRLEHIRLIGNLTALVDKQIEDPNDVVDNLTYRPPIEGTNQRSIVAFFATDDTAPNIINDPNMALFEKFTAAELLLMFPGISGQWDNAAGTDISIETPKIQVTSSGDITTIENSGDASYVIKPGSSVFVYVANIVKGLGDDRYGDKEGSDDFIFTGAYTPISQADIDENVLKDFDVWGGDCYITRSIINLRDNAPAATVGDIPDDENMNTLSSNTIPPAGLAIDYVSRTSSFFNFTEIIDLWVESEVNGHFMFRSPEQYPAGIKLRDPDNSTIPIGVSPGIAEYSYPEFPGTSIYLKANNYLYNPGYSALNDDKSWITKQVGERLNAEAPARLHYTDVGIISSGDYPDRFLVNDFHDLDASVRDIMKISKVANKKVVVVQEDGIAILHLGQTLSEGIDGLTISLTSGQVIGYAQYLSNTADSGDAGGAFTRGIIEANGVVYVMDLKREQVVAITSRGIKRISHGLVQSYIRESMLALPYYSASEVSVTTWWDNIRKRVVFMRNTLGNAYGFSLLTEESKIESFREYAEAINIAAVIVNGGKQYGFVNNGAILPVPALYKLEANDDRSVHMGRDNVSEFTIVLNNGRHRTEPKTLVNVISQSSDQPSGSDVTVEEDGTSAANQTVTDVQFRKNRHNSYIANEYRDTTNPSRRISDPNMLIRIYNSARAGLIRFSEIITTYRIRKR